ncbi:hypothetical protein [Nocardia sp. NPDC005978]|uniref:hypothetical protein n=1 Tax=unclassified Nocardia TaxID=2637762 RepID=UPI0033B0D89C
MDDRGDRVPHSRIQTDTVVQEQTLERIPQSCSLIDSEVGVASGSSNVEHFRFPPLELTLVPKAPRPDLNGRTVLLSSFGGIWGKPLAVLTLASVGTGREEY